MMHGPVIIVDDEPDALNSIETVLESAGFEDIIACDSPTSMWEALQTRGAAVVLLDLLMPGVCGEDILVTLTEDHPDIPVIMATGVNELDTAVRCMRKGAYDYLVKPLESERLIASIRHALDTRELQDSCEALKRSLLQQEVSQPEIFEDIITVTPAVQSIFKYIEAVGSSSHPILITGETGTGKELFARAVHRASGLKGAFVPVNIAGLDESVLADTLFGHEKGAFTGADSARNGLVEQASEGTLFLDEIGDLGLSAQVKLLRLIQEREYLPLGSDIAKAARVRVVAATSRPVDELQSKAKFRPDLYFRLKSHHIHLPPLRERKDDITALTNAFLVSAAVELGKPAPTAPTELYTLLGTWHFPGNVRELRAMVYDAVAQHAGRMLSLGSFKKAIGFNSLVHIHQHHTSSTEQILAFGQRLPTFKEAESLLLAEAMKRAGKNKTVAAGLLGVTRQAVSQRLKSANMS